MPDAVVHLRSNATGKIKREKRDGRETIIVPSYAAKANTVLNDVLYTKEEIEASYVGLNRTPAPLGHPEVNGQYVPALDPEALARNHVFAWNENPRLDGDRVALDVVIDEARANESEGGRKVIEAINAGDPISTSTGLLCNLGDPVGKDHKSVARNIEWDHVAILLDEEPAISTSEGVGIFVNSKTNEEIEVINSRVDWAESDLAWAAEHLLDSAERLDKAKQREALIPRLVEALRGIMSGGSAETTPNVQKEEPMDDKTKEAIDAVNAKVDAIPEAISNAISEAVKPLVDAQAEIKANQEAKDKAEKDALVEKIVAANIEGMSKDVADKMDVPALTAVLNMHGAQSKKAAPMTAGFMQNANSDEGSFSPLAGVTKQ